MGLLEFQDDLRNGLTLDEALRKHGLTFKEAVDAIHGYTRSKTKSERTLPMYISKVGNCFQIKRKIKGYTIYYGAYASLEDAMKMKAHLQQNGWYKRKLPQYRKELGIPPIKEGRDEI